MLRKSIRAVEKQREFGVTPVAMSSYSRLLLFAHVVVPAGSGLGKIASPLYVEESEWRPSKGVAHYQQIELFSHHTVQIKKTQRKKK